MAQQNAECDIQMESIRLLGRDFEYLSGIPVDRVVAFLSRVSFGDGADGCWQWMAGRWRNAYGGFAWQGRTIAAHRFSWIAFRSFIEPGNEIHHKCKNPSCVNPDHLQQLTEAEHIAVHERTNPVFKKKFNTHCKQGHELSGDNLKIVKDEITGKDHRRCKTCINAWSLAKWRRANPKAPRLERTHCRNGHRLTPENTYEHLGVKQCQTCHNANSARYYEKHLSPRANPRPPKPAKTHCKHGHPWIPENLYTYGSPGSQTTICGVCHKESANRAYEKRKERFGKQ